MEFNASYTIDPGEFGLLGLPGIFLPTKIKNHAPHRALPSEHTPKVVLFLLTATRIRLKNADL
jgi:hypothetical protein